jgi:hypothetical protein
MVGDLCPLIDACVHFAQLAQIQFQRRVRRLSHSGKQSDGCHRQNDERVMAAKDFHAAKCSELLLFV